jgi:hypothetical protein
MKKTAYLLTHYTRSEDLPDLSFSIKISSSCRWS